MDTGAALCRFPFSMERKLAAVRTQTSGIRETAENESSFINSVYMPVKRRFRKEEEYIWLNGFM